ncbi:tetratricopeptide repeat-containing sensor histidine kinase [Aureispira anguillae]|uniref:Tetratricopeptide repeat protein n=1 Tax=Aureispira anguillae TaxID=2864201 RepID=A0A916DSE8_9BACT|nr:tetratricopeptide repeat protein [Aureispira anguillae]BDS10766.1 tetratricopeptide repeat protein [Aureispira anguillae]
MNTFSPTKGIYLLYCFLFFSTINYGQPQSQIDSLEKLLSSTKDTEEQSKLLYNLAQKYLYAHPTKAIQYTQQSLSLLSKEAYNKLGYRYNLLASANAHLANFSIALTYIDSAMYFFEKEQFELGIASVYINKGAIYSQQNDYVSAAECYYKSLDINKELKDSSNISKILNNLSIVNLVLGDAAKAVENVKEALAINKKMNDPFDVASSTYNVGIVYSNTEELDSAILYLEEAQRFFLKENDVDHLIGVYSTKTSVYEMQGKIDLALQNMNQAIDLAKQSKSKESLMRLHQDRAFLLFNTQKYTQSLFFYAELLELAKQQESLHYQYEALTGLMRTSRGLKKFEDALNYFIEAFNIKNDMLSTQKQQQIRELSIKYETEKKEQENSLLAQEKELETLRADRNRQLVYLSFLAITLILVISFLLMRQYKINAQHLTNQLKHRLLRNQMNPHFIFNSLVAIQNYVYQKEPLQAGEYLASFATLIRTILENSMEEYISLEKEIQWLNNYFKLQLLRFDNSFEYNIQVDEAIDLENMLIPPMLTQPFIENALEHGLKNINYRGKISVNITIKDQILHIEVKDNGIGLENSLASSSVKTHKSLAVKITKDRLHFLNKKRGNKIYFDMKGLENKGTLVSFSLPLVYKY